MNTRLKTPQELKFLTDFQEKAKIDGEATRHDTLQMQDAAAVCKLRSERH
jgi:hypothetical protein